MTPEKGNVEILSNYYLNFGKIANLFKQICRYDVYFDLYSSITTLVYQCERFHLELSRWNLHIR